MKLLIDAMLSPALTARLSEFFPHSLHVADLGLEASDTLIWEHAKADGFTIVTKDNDFQWRAEVFGPPPKIIMIRLGNCRSALVESLIRMSLRDIEAFLADDLDAILVLPLIARGHD